VVVGNVNQQQGFLCPSSNPPNTLISPRRSPTRFKPRTRTIKAFLNTIITSEMVSTDGHSPQGSAHCSPTISPSPHQEHVKPTSEPVSRQAPTPEVATRPNADPKSAPQEIAISEIETTLQETTLEGATELKAGVQHSSCDPDANIQNNASDQKNEPEDPPKRIEEPVSEADIEEGKSAYHPGGFHPVYIGDVYDNRYKILNKIGYGVYSTVWLVKDLQQK